MQDKQEIFYTITHPTSGREESGVVVCDLSQETVIWPAIYKNAGIDTDKFRATSQQIAISRADNKLKMTGEALLEFDRAIPGKGILKINLVSEFVPPPKLSPKLITAFGWIIAALFFLLAAKNGFQPVFDIAWYWGFIAFFGVLVVVYYASSKK